MTKAYFSCARVTIPSFAPTERRYSLSDTTLIERKKHFRPYETLDFNETRLISPSRVFKRST